MKVMAQALPQITMISCSMQLSSNHKHGASEKAQLQTSGVKDRVRQRMNDTPYRLIDTVHPKANVICLTLEELNDQNMEPAIRRQTAEFSLCQRKNYIACLL